MSAHDAERAEDNAQRTKLKRAAKEAKRAKVLALWAEGDLTKTLIAERLGVDLTSVCAWIREAGNAS